LQWHPHGHILVTEGAFSDDGAFHPLETWDADAVMKLFRERLLARLIERHAISEEACYMVRAPLSLKKLVYLDGQKAVLYRSRMNPFLSRNFEVMDPLEWLARLADHIPDTGKHRTHFYGFYASRVRASRREKEGSELPVEAAPTKRRCPPNHLGLSPPEQEKPPPRREVVRVPVDDEGREILAG